MTNFNNGNTTYLGEVPAQISVRGPLPASDIHIEIVEIKDDFGRKVAFLWDAGTPSTGGRGATIRELVQSFPITIPEGAKTLDVTLAYTKSVFVEFMARPTVAKVNEKK